MSEFKCLQSPQKRIRWAGLARGAGHLPAGACWWSPALSKKSQRACPLLSLRALCRHSGQFQRPHHVPLYRTSRQGGQEHVFTCSPLALLSVLYNFCFSQETKSNRKKKKKEERETFSLDSCFQPAFSFLYFAFTLSFLRVAFTVSLLVHHEFSA